jgi:uncharacterized membrane protein
MAPRLELSAFRYRDPRTGKRVRARHGADRDEIAARYSEWEILGEPEIRDVDPDARSTDRVITVISKAQMESKQLAFALTHPQDRTFFALNAVVAWVALVMGFAPGLLGHFSGATPFHPPIVHVHAVVFTGWLALFTAQIWMIRSRRVDIHRRTRSRCCCS